jgi:DNA-binding PadR family transcriptional regulator
MSKRELSTGDYLFLAFLKTGPRSAYDLKKEMTSSVNFFWSAQHSQVYQQANRLRRDGYIEHRGSASVRNRQLLAITDEGSHAVLRGQQRQHTELLAEFERIHAVLSNVEFGDVIPGQLYALQLGIEVERAYLRWIRQTLTDLHQRQRHQ